MLSRMSKPRRTSEAIAGQTRLQQIVSKATEVFDRAGYTNASMEDIARAVGLAKPTLYHYVKSKAEILYLIHRDFMGETFAAMEARAGKRLSATEELRAVIRDIIRLMETHRPSVRVFFESFRDLPPKQRQAIVAQRDRYSRGLISVIRRGVERGEFRKVDPKLTALAVFGMCNWAYQWYEPRGKLSARQVADAFADVIVAGLAPRRTTPRPGN